VPENLTMFLHCCATRCHILRQKCTKFDSCWGSAPDPTVGAHSDPQTPYLDIRGPTTKEGEGREERNGERGGRGWAPRPPSWI